MYTPKISFLLSKTIGNCNACKKYFHFTYVCIQVIKLNNDLQAYWYAPYHHTTHIIVHVPNFLESLETRRIVHIPCIPFSKEHDRQQQQHGIRHTNVRASLVFHSSTKCSSIQNSHSSRLEFHHHRSSHHLPVISIYSHYLCFALLVCMIPYKQARIASHTTTPSSPEEFPSEFFLSQSACITAAGADEKCGLRV